jgi:23S rRNA A2030 N6-methylase RlmJ
MAGSGLVVINPPWLLKESLVEALPRLSGILGADGGAAWSVDEHLGDEPSASQK